MTRFDATEPNHHNRSGQFIWYIKRSTQFVIDILRAVRVGVPQDLMEIVIGCAYFPPIGILNC